jgi:hypothetical protein
MKVVYFVLVMVALLCEAAPAYGGDEDAIKGTFACDTSLRFPVCR